MISLDHGKKLAEAVINTAQTLGYPGVAVVVIDHSTAIRMACRTEDASLFGIEIATAKATSAFAFKRRTLEQKDMFSGNQTLVTTVAAATQGKFMPLGGGAPIFLENGELVGGIGVTGATPEDDDKIACEAVAASGFKVSK